MSERKVKKDYFEPVEPDWEQPIQEAAIKTWKRIFQLSTGKPFPDDGIVSPAFVSIIDHEMRVLVNELTEYWY